VIAEETVLDREEQYGTYVSLIPLTTEVVGVDLIGFKYSLVNYTFTSTGSAGFGVSNEIVNEEPNLCQYLDIVLNETDEQILSSLVYELVEEEKYFRNTPKLIDTFYKRINITYSNSSQISENIKKMLILIFSYEPLEWYQTKSGEPIEFDDLLYDAVISAIKCKELKKAVQELKDYRNSTVDSIDDIMALISGIYGKK